MELRTLNFSFKTCRKKFNLFEVDSFWWNVELWHIFSKDAEMEILSTNNKFILVFSAVYFIYFSVDYG